ncbi:Piso0_000238 [Millerozyma farinosa CBS 7064]|uniref:Piso0_000238 protein n=1 Tax=Pichia sorbitophila (strain ATCC MYA-4447 / BCRC 22081 / CBS 7064 / NBRC 10061 / NRRL Y-12695) TaxID=559304 RepID=G8YTF9_PICSO|nr:Piso0_000238 [Millerozyma farinosa CBS 7064]
MPANTRRFLMRVVVSWTGVFDSTVMTSSRMSYSRSLLIHRKRMKLSSRKKLAESAWYTEGSCAAVCFSSTRDQAYVVHVFPAATNPTVALCALRVAVDFFSPPPPCLHQFLHLAAAGLSVQYVIEYVCDDAWQHPPMQREHSALCSPLVTSCVVCDIEYFAPIFPSSSPCLS